MPSSLVMLSSSKWSSDYFLERIAEIHLTLEVKIQLGILNQNYYFLFTIMYVICYEKFKDLFKVENQILWSQIGVINQAL